MRSIRPRWSRLRPRRRAVTLVASVATLASSVALATGGGTAGAGGVLTPGNLLVSTSVWAQDAPITAGSTQLPPNCGSSAAPCATATAPGTYPLVFNNDGVDGSFGVTQPIVLDELNPTNDSQIASLTVPNSTQSGITPSSDQMVTSFSSKSEIALNQSTDGQYVTFMGYNAPVGALDVSNSNTPGDVDPTNTAGPNSDYRVIAQLDGNSNFQFTETNAYSGNNGRAAILDPATNTIFTAGNGGNGGKPTFPGVVTGTGTQILSPANAPESSQSPGAPTPLGNFNITELGDKADKSTKDNNYRGLTINNNVVYFTKGSGSNGVNTVYYLDTTGGTCPSGSGLPSSSATLPTASTFTSPTYSTSNAALGLTSSNPGLTPTNSCILNGFPTTLASATPTYFPFGIWFANPTTLYVADEGNGTTTYSSATNTYTAAAASTTAGLEKWTLNTTTHTWGLDYTLQSGLNLGVPYSVANSGANSYPTGPNNTDGGTGLPWTPATDGLRNLVGQVNGNGTVSIWASTSTVSGSGDPGSDPNQLVSITDNLASTTLPSGESFSNVMPATYGQVIRGVSFTPATVPPVDTPEVPTTLLLPLAVLAIGGGAVYVQRRRRRHGAMAV
ncbi:MAG: hypothetical protein ABSC90_16785 [Acidimicrobiales bacterium]